MADPNTWLGITALLLLAAGIYSTLTNRKDRP